VVVTALLLLLVSDTVVLALGFLSLPHTQVADRGAWAAPSGSGRKSSYQLRQYANSPSRKDPYTIIHLHHRDTAAVLAELDVALSTLQGSRNAPKL
jgi:hypothetical protein